ncbi:CAP domain-containing protein [Candidatus Parcubacteria bacterium]|nr:CAP domain-containing protein [Candidatus Parcubacteria bacterium]
MKIKKYKFQNKTYKKSNSNKFKYCLLSFFLLAIFLLPNIGYFSSITEQEIINLTNKERVKNNLGKLTPNNLLIEAAQQKANDILKYQTFEHNLNGNKFSDWIKKSNYNYYYIGENLAIDFMVSGNVISAWMKSESHKANILNKNFDEIGIAVVDGKFENRNTTIIVQIFGSSLNKLNTSSGIINTNTKNSNISNPPHLISYEKENFNLFVLILSIIFIISIIKIAIIIEYHYRKHSIHNKIKAKINL